MLKTSLRKTIFISGLGICLLTPTAMAMASDIVFVNGKIQTVDKDRSWAEALCITGNTISYVGDDAGAKSCISDSTRVIDLEGRLVLPGFMDSHLHPFYGAASDAGVNLSVADTMEKLSAALHEMKRLNPGNDPIYSRGWQNFLFPPQGPNKNMLDDIFGDRAIILGSVDGHSSWFSSGALNRAGVDKSIKDPKPGVSFWERDPQTGELLGTAREGAGSLVGEKLIKRTKAFYKKMFMEWLPRANASGLTGVFDAGMGAPTMLDAYDILAELDDANALTLRYFTTIVGRKYGDKTAADRFLEIEKKYTSTLVKPTSIKFMADGVPEAHTAFMLEDYKDTPGNRGKPLTDPQDLKSMILDAEQKNVSVHIHAIGDAAVRLSLDAIEQARTAVTGDGKRHAIGHMDYVTPEDVIRFKELNVVPQTSIQWATVDPSYDTFVRYVGNKVHDGAYPIRDILDAGGKQTFGTDWPAAAYLSTYKPLIQIETAVTRRLSGVTTGPERGEQQNISVMEAIEALTINVAYQVHEEDYLGSLEVGKVADIIALDTNIFEIPVHTIHKTSVDITVVNGKIVYEE